MGVKDLWKLLDAAGRPVDMEQLRGLVLAIDVSVWLHQAVHGARDRAGQPLQSAHISLLFSRICKLLHYQIKPVFVFDGGTPSLKHRILAARSKRRQSAGRKGQKVEEKQRSKYMQARILQQLSGEKSSNPPPPPHLPPVNKQPDMFELPPLPNDTFNLERSPENQRQTSFVEDVDRVDVDSSDFSSLPPDLQHEILQERQESTRHTYTHPDTLPPSASDFSNYQLDRLLQRNKLSQQLERVRKTLKEGEAVGGGMIGGQVEVGGHQGLCEVESNRIMSSDSAHYILVKGIEEQSSSSRDEMDDIIINKDDVIGITDEISKGEILEPRKDDVIIEQNDVVEEIEPLPLEKERDQKKCHMIQNIGIVSQRGSVGSLVTYHSDEHQFIGQEDEEEEEKEEEEEEEEKRTPSPVSSPSSDKPILPALHVNSHPTTSEESLDPTTTVHSIIPQCSTIGSLPLYSVTMNTLTSPVLVHESDDEEEEEETVEQVEEDWEEIEGVEEKVEEIERVEEKVEEKIVWEEEMLQLSPGEAQTRLRQEVTELGAEVERQRRTAASLHSHVYREIQELLSLFGLPFIVSPMEAEAQCAYLDHTHQTDGCITDDNDVFLFGGQRVYRHFFNQDHLPSLFEASTITSLLGLTREKLICLAFLLGSDYTTGLDGVGVVSAMEVIGQFSGNGIDILQKLKEWHSVTSSAPGLSLKSSLERKLRSTELPNDFPSQEVWDAYQSPEVDNSAEQFHWGSPDLDLIRKFMLNHVGWNQDRVDSALLPVLKRANDRRKITSYFTPSLSLPSTPVAINSKRVRNVVARITNRDSTRNEEDPPKPKRSKVDSSRPSKADGAVQGGGGGGGRGRKVVSYGQNLSLTNLSASSSSSSDEE